MPQRLTITVNSSAEIPGVIQQQIEDVKRDVAQFDYREVFTDTVLPWLRREHDKYFKTGQGPSGAWEPLARSTILKKGHDAILIDTRRLMRSLITRTADSIQAAQARSMEFGTRVPYAVYHQYGSKITGAKRAKKPQSVSRLTKSLLKDVRKQLSERSRNTPKLSNIHGMSMVPARPLVGLNGLSASKMAKMIADGMVESISR